MIKGRYWSDCSPSTAALLDDLRQLGFVLDTIITSDPEPTMEWGGQYAHGWSNIYYTFIMGRINGDKK